MTLVQTLFSFNGRINRKKWWLARLLLMGIMVGVYLVLGIFSSVLFRPVFGNDGIISDIGGMGLMELLIIWSIIIYFIAGLAINVKRWHDRDRSAWWLLIEFIPILNMWAFIELGCLKGTYGKNRFGPDPLEHE